jgi:hypothetical protein
MLNEKQFERWQILIRACKSRQRKINVGGKSVREMLIALDEFVTAQQSMRPTGGDSPASKPLSTLEDLPLFESYLVPPTSG